jgi:hypothetical protein
MRDSVLLGNLLCPLFNGIDDSNDGNAEIFEVWDVSGLRDASDTDDTDPNFRHNRPPPSKI